MSPSFQHAFGTTTSSRFAFISGLTRRRIWSYGIREGKWYTLQFEFLPMYCDSPIAGDRGLLCCLRPANPTQGIHDLELYVCNPLTQAWRKLPFPSRVQRFDLVHMVTDTETKQYTITTVSQRYSRQSGSSKQSRRFTIPQQIRGMPTVRVSSSPLGTIWSTTRNMCMGGLLE